MLYWNQRTFSSFHSSASSGAIGVRVKRGAVSKPPVSDAQYGTPDSEKLRPAGICLRIAVHVVLMSPDHVAEAYRCWPANAERVRMTTRLSGAAARWPS